MPYRDDHLLVAARLDTLRYSTSGVFRSSSRRGAPYRDDRAIVTAAHLDTLCYSTSGVFRSSSRHAVPYRDDHAVVTAARLDTLRTSMSGYCHSSEFGGNRLNFLASPRRCFFCSRFIFAWCGGLVWRRGLGAAAAFCSSLISRSIASNRFLSWVRKRLASIIRIPSLVSRLPAK